MTERVRKLLVVDPKQQSACYAIVYRKESGVSWVLIDLSNRKPIAATTDADTDDDMIAWLMSEERGSEMRVSVRLVSDALCPKWTNIWAQSGNDPARPLTKGNGRSNRRYLRASSRLLLSGVEVEIANAGASTLRRLFAMPATLVIANCLLATMF